MRNQIDNVRPTKGGSFRRCLSAKAELRISDESARKSSAGFCRRQSQPRPLTKTGRQQLTGHSKTKYPKIVTVRDLKWLRCVCNGKIPKSADLLVVTLLVATHPFQAQIDKAQIILAARDVRSQP